MAQQILLGVSLIVEENHVIVRRGLPISFQQILRSENAMVDTLERGVLRTFLLTSNLLHFGQWFWRDQVDPLFVACHFVFPWISFI